MNYLKIILKENIKKHLKNKLLIENYSFLNSLKSEICKIAQEVYDNWEQNNDGYCDVLGYGGICQDIANGICSLLNEKNIECTTVSQEIDEQHVYVVAKTEEGIFETDIPPYLYETGGGYCWKKIPDVKFEERFVIIKMISPDPEEFENYIER
jgi:hypothetical protein